MSRDSEVRVPQLTVDGDESFEVDDAPVTAVSSHDGDHKEELDEGEVRTPARPLRRKSVVDATKFIVCSTQRKYRRRSSFFLASRTSAISVSDALAQNHEEATAITQSPRTSSSQVVKLSRRGTSDADHLPIWDSVSYASALLDGQDDIEIALATLLQDNRFIVVVTRGPTEAVLLGLEAKAPSKELEMAICVPISRRCRLESTGDLSFSFTPTGASFRYVFSPASMLSLWSSYSTLLRILEGADMFDPDEPWPWLEPIMAKLDPLLGAKWMVDVDKDALDRQSLYEVDGGGLTPLQTRIVSGLKEILHASDLDQVTVKAVRTQLEEQVGENLKPQKKFIDKWMMIVMGQMEPASQITDSLYLGSEWNAGNLEELLANRCTYILNVTSEIAHSQVHAQHPDFHHLRISVSDEASSDLLSHWEQTYKFIREAEKNGAACLVHCQMGVSRSASTVIAYLMKLRRWSLSAAMEHTKKSRPVIKPNKGFWKQLQTYEGILRANRRTWITPKQRTMEDYLLSLTTVLKEYIPAIQDEYSTIAELTKASQENLEALMPPALAKFLHHHLTCSTPQWAQRMATGRTYSTV